MRLTTRQLSQNRNSALNALAERMGFVTWRRFETELKRAHEQGQPITVTIGTGKEKKVYSPMGAPGQTT